MITNADRGNISVIIDKSYYNKKISRALVKSVYTILCKYDTSRIQIELNSLIGK